MENGERLSLEQIRAWVEAGEEVRFHSQDRGELYEWVNQTLRQQDYGRLKRGGKGLVRRYLAKMTGLSRAQAARLIRSYQQGGEVKPRAYRRHRFSKPYTRADIEVLAAVDEAHETMSGRATQKILQRAWHEYHDAQCERLARLSVAQLYRLPKSGTYRHRRVAYQPTRPTQVAIGERRQTRPARAAGISARGHRASRRPGRSEGFVPYQRGGWSDAMAGGRRHGADLGSPADASGSANTSVTVTSSRRMRRLSTSSIGCTSIRI